MKSKFDILIVEDEQVIIDSARKVLGQENYSIDQAFDVAEALVKLDRIGYKLILSDLMLPNKSGIELIEKVKSRSIPVIMITGYATLENTIKAFRFGAFDFIPKPFDVEELLGVVYRGISMNQARKKLLPTSDYFKNQPGTEKQQRYYTLGDHSWAKILPEGVAIFGLGQTFPYRMGNVQKIEFPTNHAEILQGNLCLSLQAEGHMIHRVWAPLSGKVIATNPEIISNVDLLDADPLNRGWLIKVIPTNLESEIKNLIKI